ncbi:hypothetical protein OK016_00220 [Vibrio chagasii]|nr:hypothetical protein [Vibrio chagasii]
MVQRSLSLMALALRKPRRVPVSDDVYVGGDTASATITDATRNFESLVKRPNSSNDDHQ